MRSGEKKVLLKTIKEMYVRRRVQIWGIILHATLMGLALIVAYNTYKEAGSLMYGKYFLSHALKTEIKDTFPWAILICTLLYILIGRNKGKGALAFREYRTLFILQIAIFSAISISKGPHVVIVLGLSLVFFAIFLSAGFGAIRTINLGKEEFTELVSSCLHKLVQNALQIKERPSTLFVIVFIGLTVQSSFLLAFKKNSASEHMANIAFCSLLIGVGIEIYDTVKGGTKDREPKK